MEPLPILYTFRRCPYAIRARMALLLNDIPVAVREVTLKDKPDSLLAYSTKGTVPVLVINDHFIIEQSREIIEWAVQHADKPAFDLPCLEQQVLISRNDDKFKASLDKYKYSDRHPGQPQHAYREECEGFLKLLEQRLIHSDYLFTDNISYADVAIFPFVRQFVGVDSQWFESANYPNIKRWLSLILSGENFQRIMTKYAQWHEDDDVIQSAVLTGNI